MADEVLVELRKDGRWLGAPLGGFYVRFKEIPKPCLFVTGQPGGVADHAVGSSRENMLIFAEDPLDCRKAWGTHCDILPRGSLLMLS